MTIPVVDIFAGPGGLGEGFSTLKTKDNDGRAFRIAVSAEMERNAARTLHLRSFFRQFPSGAAPSSYYAYLNGWAAAPWTNRTRAQWEAASEEALQLTLGKPEDDSRLLQRVAKVAASGNPWVLIGGPPCQAYSLVGRSRNSGIKGYRPEKDARHFLYKHYLHIISQYQPTAFIMENVKGILSSKVNGNEIFPQILQDLRQPGGRGQRRYRILPLVEPAPGLLGDEFDHGAYVVRAEQFGVPQARHRVILFGLSEDIPAPQHFLRPQSTGLSVRDAIGAMPPLRSGITDEDVARWPRFAATLLRDTARAVRTQYPDVARRLSLVAKEAEANLDPGCGGVRVPDLGKNAAEMPGPFRRWVCDRHLSTHLNHETRAHMRADLMRYAFAAAFAAEHGRSPKGHTEFPSELEPAHENWKSGKFADRFKVQTWDDPSSTVTSHLAKDGHYFIHPDPGQLRSITVREAARLQTFPDNYFFEGPRGAQFKQVGNAVPPLLARQIAKVVHSAINC